MMRPKPMMQEAHGDWMDRCMANGTMMDEMTDTGARRAACEVMWDNRGKKTAGVAAATKTLDLPFELKAFGDAGTFEGYAAVFGNVDLGGDVIERGAFKEIVKGRNGLVKILNQHNSRDPIGAATVKQDDKGLQFSGQLVLESAGARNAYALMKAGVLDGMSIGYDVLEGGARILESGIRQLKALKLWEISPVTFGMNQLAGIESVKAAPQFDTIRECEAWLRDELGFTHSAAKEFIARFKKALVREGPTRDESEASEYLKFLNSITEKCK